MQPTDPSVWSVFVSLGTKAARRNERGTGKHPEGFLAMKNRILRLAITLSSVAAIALAGGATLKGF